MAVIRFAPALFISASILAQTGSPTGAESLTSAGIILLFVVGLGLIFVEILLPGVVFGLFGIGCVIAAVFLAFRESAALGWTLGAIGLLSVPFFLFFWTKIVGKYLAITTTQAGQTVSKGSGLEKLLGQEGVALTTLRPSGIARIGDRKVDVVAEGEIIERDMRIRVVEVKGNRVVVRAVRV